MKIGPVDFPVSTKGQIVGFVVLVALSYMALRFVAGLSFVPVAVKNQLPK